MTKTVKLAPNQKPTEEQKKEVREAARREIVFDDDCPQMTDAMKKAFQLAAKARNRHFRNSVS